jgi:hypothetical protein
MKIIKIISEWKKSCNVKYGFKRVEAIVEENGQLVTRHIDIEK